MTAIDSLWIEICPIDSIPLRGCRVVRTRHLQVALFRTASDEVFALENRCPHKGGPLSEVAPRAFFFCAEAVKETSTVSSTRARIERGLPA